MTITVDRKYKKSSYTISNLYINGVWICNVIEDKDRGLDKTWPLSRIKAAKVPNETAIPTGTYAVTIRVYSPKFGQRKTYNWCKGYLPRLLGVPGFDGILVHGGSTAADSAGCLIPGMNTAKGKVTRSMECLRKIYDALKGADDRGESIFITIK